MPNKDKTGPEGKGPKTGRGLGDCSEDKNQEDDACPQGIGQRKRCCQNNKTK